ncbi:MAG TPA: hypothetical protein VNZ66_04290 [Aeromicrobium sp.]|nr:hypothetical protein [Aeromicrobium sp.]
MKKTLAVAGIVLMTGSMAACGGSDSGAYCDTLKSAESQFAGLENGDADVIEKAFSTFHELAGEAPSEVKDDWKKLDGAVTMVEDAFEEAGLKMSDLAKLQTGDIPEGVDLAKLQDAATSFQELDSQEFEDASAAIEKHAKDECGVDLS